MTKSHITANFDNHTLSLTKSFYKKACMVGSDEYKALRTAMGENPTYTLNILDNPNKNTYRPDLSWIVMKRIENFLNDNKITKDMVNRFRDIIYDNLLNDNQAYYLAREAILKHKEFEELLADNKFLNIISK